MYRIWRSGVPVREERSRMFMTGPFRQRLCQIIAAERWPSSNGDGSQLTGLAVRMIKKRRRKRSPSGGAMLIPPVRGFERSDHRNDTSSADGSQHVLLF